MNSTYLLIFIIFIAFGCRPRANSNLKITNGKELAANQQYPSVVRLASAFWGTNKEGTYEWQYKWCTGVWLSDQVVVTAEQCVWHSQYAINWVFIMAGAGSGGISSAKSIVRQSQMQNATQMPTYQGMKNPLGLAAILFGKGSSKHYAPVAATTPNSGTKVSLVGYGATEIKASTITDHTPPIVVGENSIRQTSPYIMIDDEGDSTQGGRSLAVDGDMGSPLVFGDQIQAIAVDLTQNEKGIWFNRYVSLSQGPGKDFLTKLNTAGLLAQNLEAKQQANSKKLLVSTTQAELDKEPRPNGKFTMPNGIITAAAANYDWRNNTTYMPIAGVSPDPKPNVPPPINPDQEHQEKQGNQGNQLPLGQGIFADKSCGTDSKIKDRQKIVIVSAEWCGPCGKYHATVDSDPTVKENTKDKLFITWDDDACKNTTRLYEVTKLPTTLIIDAKGQLKASQPGVMSANGLVQWINRKW